MFPFIDNLQIGDLIENEPSLHKFREKVRVISAREMCRGHWQAYWVIGDGRCRLAACILPTQLTLSPQVRSAVHLVLHARRLTIALMNKSLPILMT
jgi:hypothetical protein